MMMLAWVENLLSVAPPLGPFIPKPTFDLLEGLYDQQPCHGCGEKVGDCRWELEISEGQWELFCDYCVDEYGFRCAECDEMVGDKETVESCAFVFYGDEDQGLEPGYYQAVRFPIWSGPMVGRCDFERQNIKKIADLLPDHEKSEDDYSAQFLCEQCRASILARSTYIVDRAREAIRELKP